MTATNGSPGFTLGMPIVLQRGKKDKKKRRYTSGVKEIQKIERGFSKAAKRVASALSKGATNYSERSDKSSQKKRVGAIRDALENYTRAIGKTVRVASKAPTDFIERVNTKPISRAVRATVRMVVPPIFR
jgi:hypothetical protein